MPHRLNQSVSKRISAITKDIRDFASTKGFQEELRDLLLALCRVETTPSPDVSKMRTAEERCFGIIEEALKSVSLPGLRLERLPINPGIASHPNYSLLHFTKTKRQPKGLSAEEAYRGRSNLVCVIPGAEKGARGKSVALNAHIDVVAPYFPPVCKSSTVVGRGACDDKGPLVSILGALKLIARLLPEHGLTLRRNVVGMFVIEEETGGNGSLSLAVDPELRELYETIIVCECTGMKLHPANRGAVWYAATLRPPRGVSALELFAYINEEMEKEGVAIRAESSHDLFPQRPVQTCHGMIGPFGEHPSRICGSVSFRVEFRDGQVKRSNWAGLERLIVDCLNSGLATYIGLYGDKSLVTDPATGQAMVPSHYKTRRVAAGLVVQVHGATGHMGAIRERDGAITKMAHLVRSLVASRERIERVAGGTFKLTVDGHTQEELIAEGGQGFLPTHTIQEVMDRQRRAAERGAETYLRRIGKRGHGRDVVTVAYEKLHNVAFDGDPDSESMRNALKAAEVCGLPEQLPLRGWTVSCDARLFATQYPGMEVLTFGPGELHYAHSDAEQVELRDVCNAAAFLAHFILFQTGTLEREC